MLLDLVSSRRDSREKMTETMYRHAMSTAFKNWHSLALAAVLYAVNVFLLSIGNDMIVKSSQSLEGWVILVVSGYLFIGAVYLVSATLTENSTLSESFRNHRPLQNLHRRSNRLRHRLLPPVQR